MTDYKEKGRGKGHRSLYLGLLFNILIGFLFAVAIYCLIRFPARYFIGEYYVTPKMQESRRAEYMLSLDYYVHDNNISAKTVNDISGWIRDNPYVYLLVYQSPDSSETASVIPPDIIKPGDRDKLIELVGARIDESISRAELMAKAQSNGYHQIVMQDGHIIVALHEYTENLYYATFEIISIFAAILSFVFALVRYIGVLIGRIKRFESDVTIVAEIDMNYEIISEGRDEISNLSTQVESMRRTMLDHIKNEQEAREANTELITSISHDIRTPLTVLMGYIEMMKDHAEGDRVMQSYIDASESTALRLKNLSDDMFKYSLAFGDTKKSVKLDEYDFLTLNEQLFFEHFLLMREQGYDIQTEITGEPIAEGTTVRTDAANLMRIVDNIFSNIGKYADKSHPVVFTMHSNGEYIVLECKNRIRTDTEGAESNGIGLKTCVRLGSLVARKFEYKVDGETFVARLVLDIKPPVNET